MRTIADEQVLTALVERLRNLRLDTRGRWGVLTAGELVCHLGDAHELSKTHFLFGPMSARDWHRWAYRHVSHHLKQFGL